jgi:hypothetical protein
MPPVTAVEPTTLWDKPFIGVVLQQQSRKRVVDVHNPGFVFDHIGEEPIVYPVREILPVLTKIGGDIVPIKAKLDKLFPVGP